MAAESLDGSEARMDMGALWLAIRRRLLRIVVLTAVLLGIAYTLLLFVPKSYESTASILVENRDSIYTQPANATASSQAPTESPDAIISSQIELVKSRDTLLPVVRQLNLAQVPEFNGAAGSSIGFLSKFLKKPSASANPEETALDNLSDHLTVIRERDSALISVIVWSADPVLASNLANAIAKADVARRADLSLSDTADASQWLQQQITQMQQRVSEAETKVANFKVDNDLYTGANSTSLPDQQLTEVSTQITAAQERKDTAQSRAVLIRGLLAAGQPIDGVDDVRNSVTIQQLSQQKAQLTAQRAQLLATLLPTHPSVTAVTAQIAAIDHQVEIEGRRVADALDAEGKIETTVIASLQTNLDALKAKVANATRQQVTLDALDREATADRDLLESYMTRYRDAASRTDANSALPDVRVITAATPSSTPAAPKTSLILGAVTFVSLAVQIGAILFGELLSGRALIEPAGRGGDNTPVEVPLIPSRPARPPPVEADEAGMDERMAEASAAEAPVVARAETAAPAETWREEPAETEKPIAPMAQVREDRNLRKWFSRRAHVVGSSLSSYEPPDLGRPRPEPVGAPAATEPGDRSWAELIAADPAQPLTEAIAAIARDTAAQPSPAPLAGEPRKEAQVPAAQGPTDAVGETENARRLANLSADLVLGRVRVLVLAAIDTARDSELLGARLIAEALQRGLSVARVDAGSHRPSTEPGLTDLATGDASFGDIVHRTAQEGLAEVPWGHLAALERQSNKPMTLVEALSDLYEVVLIDVGLLEPESTLSMFTELSAKLVLVAPAGADPGGLDAARVEAAVLGYRQVDAIAAPPRQAEVA